MQLTPAQEAHLRQCFDDLDVDKTGSLDTTETANLLRLLGCNPTDEEVDEVMLKADVDESNALEFDEFKALVVPVIQKAITDMREEFEKAFNEFDKDGSGKLDKEELREALKTKGSNKMTDEEFDELVEEIDTDGDGKLDKDELMKRFCEDLERLSQEAEAQESQD